MIWVEEKQISTTRCNFNSAGSHSSGTITQPAIAPRQAPAQTLLVLSSNPTRNRPSLGRTSFIFSHYRLPDHVSKTPTNTVTSFPNSTLLSQHQQAITEKSSNHITQSCHGARLAAASWPLAAAARSGARKNGRGQRISHPVAMRHLTCRRKSWQGQGGRKKIWFVSYGPEGRNL